MKKLSLSILTILFAGASVFANGHTGVKKAKQATCHSCTKAHCTQKADCPNTTNCVCK